MYKVTAAERLTGVENVDIKNITEESIQRGIQDVANGDVHDLGSFSQYFSYNVFGWLNTQYVKASSQQEAYAEAVHVAAGESNLYGFGEIKGEELERAIAEDFNGCLHIP